MSTFYLVHKQARQSAIDCILQAPSGYVVKVEEPTRRVIQNSKMWALLKDVSEQVDWYGQKLTDDEWKDVLTALHKKQKIVQGIDGGIVVIGARTSKMTVKEMSELIEVIYWFGSEKGVKFSAQEEEKY